MAFERQVAKKARIQDIVNGKFVPGSRGSGEGEFVPSVVINQWGEKISRVNLIATVTEKFKNPEGTFASLTVDDGTGAIQARVFGEDVGMFDELKKGDLVLLIGRMKEYQGSIYVQAEIVNRSSIENETLRRLELLEHLYDRKNFVENIRNMAKHLSIEELREHAKRVEIDDQSLEAILEEKEVDYKPQILKFMESLDDGDGVEVSKLFGMLTLPDNVVERAIDDLLNEGSIYEPFPGKFKPI